LKGLIKINQDLYWHNWYLKNKPYLQNTRGERLI